MTSIKLPNEARFLDDDREITEKDFWRQDSCMTSCKAEVKIIGRARTIDVTPDDKVPRKSTE